MYCIDMQLLASPATTSMRVNPCHRPGLVCCRPGPVQFDGPLLDLYLHYCSVGLGSPSSAVRAACVGMLGPLLLRTSESMGDFLSTMLRMAEEVRENQTSDVPW